MTPFTVLFGMEPVFPLDHALRNLSDVKVWSVDDRICTRSKVQQVVHQHIADAAAYAACYANKHRCDLTFEVG